MAKKNHKKYGDPRKNNQNTAKKHLYVGFEDMYTGAKEVFEATTDEFNSRVQKATTLEDLAKVYITVNHAIDKISDHEFKKMGKMSADYKSMARIWNDYGFDFKNCKETVESEISIFNFLSQMEIGGHIYRNVEDGSMVVYTRVA